MNLSLQNNYRMLIQKFKIATFDSSLNWGVDIGNIETSIRIGFMMAFYQDGNILLRSGYGTTPSKLNYNRTNYRGFSIIAGSEASLIANSLETNSRYTDEYYDLDPIPYVFDIMGGISYGFKNLSAEFSYFAQSKTFETQNYFTLYGRARIMAKW